LTEKAFATVDVLLTDLGSTVFPAKIAKLIGVVILIRCATQPPDGAVAISFSPSPTAESLWSPIPFLVAVKRNLIHLAARGRVGGTQVVRRIDVHVFARAVAIANVQTACPAEGERSVVTMLVGGNIYNRSTCRVVYPIGKIGSDVILRRGAADRRQIVIGEERLIQTPRVGVDVADVEYHKLRIALVSKLSTRHGAQILEVRERIKELDCAVTTGTHGPIFIPAARSFRGRKGKLRSEGVRQRKFAGISQTVAIGI
jgi:hypothetical protein